MRRHGWQPPLHPLQAWRHLSKSNDILFFVTTLVLVAMTFLSIKSNLHIVAMVVFTVLMVPFYVFLGPFLGNRVAENTIITVFSFAAMSVIILFIRCTAIDPSDRTSRRKERAAKKGQLLRLNHRFILTQFIKRLFKKMENRIQRYFIRRKYFNPSSRNGLQFQPLLPFPLSMIEDAVTPHAKDEEYSYCSLCDLEVKMSSKHCRSCDRCVEGFDHHCRWLNNCIGKKNYTTFILLMVFVLLMLTIEGSTAIAIFIRCLADRRAMAHDLHKRLNRKFPTGVLIGISVLLAFVSAYSLAALGQLFLFHVVLIRKGMRTYDYIMAMKEEQETIDPFDDLDSDSDDSTDLDSPQKGAFLFRFFRRGGNRSMTSQGTRRLSIRIENSSTAASPKKIHFEVNPWRLINMSKERALQAAEKAREKIRREKQTGSSEQNVMKPLPSEMKHGPVAITGHKTGVSAPTEMAPITTSDCWISSSSAASFSSPRRRFSGSPSPRPQKYRSNFDLKLTHVSRELESHISGQMLCSVLKEGGEDDERSPS